MCECRKEPGFKESLDLAIAKKKETGEEHVVYHKPAVKKFFVCPESGVNDELEICCYFKSDGTEVKYEPKGDAPAADSVDEAKEIIDISDADYKKFVDKGQVSKTILKTIAEKVKTQSELTERENAIFVAKTGEINEIIAEA